MFVLIEMRNGSPRNDATHTMTNHINDNIFLLVFLHVVADKILNLVCCLLTHLSDIALCIVLIGLGDEEIGIG